MCAAFQSGYYRLFQKWCHGGTGYLYPSLLFSGAQFVCLARTRNRWFALTPGQQVQTKGGNQLVCFKPTKRGWCVYDPIVYDTRQSFITEKNYLQISFISP